MLAQASSFHVDLVRGSDSNDGSQYRPFRTIARAIKEVDGIGGEIELAPGSGPYRECVIIKKGGTSDTPLVIEGHGAVVNLGTDVTKGPWIDTGNGFALGRNVQKNGRAWLATVAFVNGLPVFCDSPKGSGPFHDRPRAWHGGWARYDENGRILIVFPRGLNPGNSVVVLTGGVGGDFACGLHFDGASHVRVRNLTAAFASNDGFNFHNGGFDIALENVKGLFNGDQGFSAHETCQVDVRTAEAAFNGSGDGAVEDIQSSVTSYHNIRVHQNRNDAFSFARQDPQGHHLLDGVISYGNGHTNLPPPSPKIEMVDCKNLGAAGETPKIPTVADPNASAPQNPAEDDSLGRFLQLRPPNDGGPK